MRGNRRVNTKPELYVRKLLYALGYRYRLHVQSLPGRPDIVFRSRRCAIQVHGCFWHQHSDPFCPLSSRPRSNKRYWNAKLNRNVIRDREHDQKIRFLGWRVLTIWECECRGDRKLTTKLARFLGPPKWSSSAAALHTPLIYRHPGRLDDRRPARDLALTRARNGAGPRCGLSGMSQPSVIRRLRVVSSSSALSSAPLS